MENTTRQSPECSEEERRGGGSNGKKYILENNQSFILSLWIGLGQPSSRCSVVWVMAVRGAGYMDILSYVFYAFLSPSEGYRKVFISRHWCTTGKFKSLRPQAF